jgi:curved DNA-binding protein CbpA
MRSHYEVLGLSEDASQATIRSTYLKLLHIYHPDHNSDPLAGARTAEIIEAYSVLGDDTRRKRYDAELHPGASGAGTSTKTQSGPPQKRVVCEMCGAQNSTLRISSFLGVFSLIIVTRRGGKSGIWCERCRVKVAAIWSTITGLVGWWGFPYGPIYTVPALYYNAVGGKQNPANNAAMLRLVAYQLYERGEVREASAAADSSVTLEADRATKQFAEYLKTIPGSDKAKRTPIFKVLTAVPSFAIVILVACLLRFALGFAPASGYAGRYEGSSGSASPTASATPKKDTGRETVSDYVDQLANAVKTNATPTGTTHQVGTTTISEYELDRTKYSAAPFYSVASNIRPYLGDASVNADGFVSSAYFNAQLMGLSVAIVNGFNAGADVSNEIDLVGAMRVDPVIGPWIEASKYRDAYAQLCLLLDRMKISQTISQSTEQRTKELDSLKNQIDLANANVESAESRHDATSDQLWVITQNREVEQYNSLLRRDKRSHVLYVKTDLAFNRCLDPATLMSKFDTVQLTEGASAVDALPTNE